MIQFEVLGVPAPKGSAKAFWRPGWKHAVVTHDSAKTKPWERAVVDGAHGAMAGKAPFADAVSVSLHFYLPRPASASKRVVLQAKKPDLDKLVRCVLDGLTVGGVVLDDAQVVEVRAEKQFAAGAFDPLGACGLPRVCVMVEHYSLSRADYGSHYSTAVAQGELWGRGMLDA